MNVVVLESFKQNISNFENLVKIMLASSALLFTKLQVFFIKYVLFLGNAPYLVNIIPFTLRIYHKIFNSDCLCR